VGRSAHWRRVAVPCGKVVVFPVMKPAIVLLALVLAGCTESFLQAAEEECSRRGIALGTEAYADCVKKETAVMERRTMTSGVGGGMMVVQ